MLDKNEKPTDQKPVGSRRWVDTAYELEVVTPARKYLRSSCSPLCGRQEGCSDSETFLGQAGRWAVCALVLETGRGARRSRLPRASVVDQTFLAALVYRKEGSGLAGCPSCESPVLGNPPECTRESCRRRGRLGVGQAIPWGCHSIASRPSSCLR